MAIPYAPNRLYQPDSSIIQLIQQAGHDAAQGQRAGGAIWGNAVNNIGQIAAGTIQDIAAGKARAAEIARRDALEAPVRAQQLQLGQLNIQKGQREQADAEAEAMKAQKLSELFSSGTPTPNSIIALMGPQRGIAIAQGMAALQPDSEKQITRYKDQMNLFRDAIGGLAATPAPLKPQAWQMARSGLIAKGLISEDMVPAEWSPEAEATAINFGRAPEKHEGFTLNPGDVRFDANGKRIASVAPKPPEHSTARTWVMRPGPDGKLAAVRVSEGEIQPGDQPANSRSGEGRPSNGVEKSTLSFFNRAKQADEELAKLADVIGQKGTLAQGYMALAPNFMQTQEGQSYQQAQRAFTEARLRKDSGAAIPEQEFANDRRTYFVQPGDSKETIAQKERSRSAVLASLAFGSGRALNEFYGEEAPSLLEGYKARQGGNAPKAAPVSAPEAPKSDPELLTVTIEGQSVTFPSKAALQAWKKQAGVK